MQLEYYLKNQIIK